MSSRNRLYCDGAEWHGGTVMLISQFMGRLARANRAHKTSRIPEQERTKTEQEGSHRKIQFNSILFYADVRSRSV
jgi:hypothetical protein